MRQPVLQFQGSWLHLGKILSKPWYRSNL